MTSPAGHPFLLTLLRGGDGEAAILPSGGDRVWEQVISDADEQAVTPLLYRRLRQSAWDSQLPPHWHEQLRKRIFGLAARSLSLAQELAAILRAFNVHGIACMPLRGPALAEHLYGDLTLRPMGDLDLLVPRHSLEDVGVILTKRGFVEMDRRPGFSRAYSNTLEFFKDQHGWIIVEPHWTIAYPPFAERLDMDTVWGRSVQGEAVGVPTRLLSREDLLLHLCLHVIHRGREAPLLWYYELDRLICREQGHLDWSSVMQLARQTGQASLVTHVFKALQMTFHTPVPREALSLLPRPSLSGMTRRSSGWVDRRLARLMINESNVDGIESFALLLTLKSLRAKFTYARGLLFPSPAFMVVQYGLSTRKTLGLWYLRRLGRLTWEGLKGVLSLIGWRRRVDPGPGH